MPGTRSATPRPPTSTITARDGSTVLGIENVRHLVGRGVLLDLPAAKGLDRLASNHEVTGDDLDEAAEWAGVEIRSGAIVLIRTGRIQLFFEGGAGAYLAGPDGDGANPGFFGTAQERLSPNWSNIEAARKRAFRYAIFCNKTSGGELGRGVR